MQRTERYSRLDYWLLSAAAFLVSGSTGDIWKSEQIQRTTGWVVPQKWLKNKNTRHAHLKSRILVTPSVFCFLTCVTLVISTLKLAHCGDKSQQQETSYMTIKIWKEFRALQSKRSLHTAVCFRWKPSWARTRTVASEHSRFNISTSYERF